MQKIYDTLFGWTKAYRDKKRDLETGLLADLRKAEALNNAGKIVRFNYDFPDHSGFFQGEASEASLDSFNLMKIESGRYTHGAEREVKKARESLNYSAFNALILGTASSIWCIGAYQSATTTANSPYVIKASKIACEQELSGQLTQQTSDFVKGKIDELEISMNRAQFNKAVTECVPLKASSPDFIAEQHHTAIPLGTASVLGVLAMAVILKKHSLRYLDLRAGKAQLDALKRNQEVAKPRSEGLTPS